MRWVTLYMYEIPCCLPLTKGTDDVETVLALPDPVHDKFPIFQFLNLIVLCLVIFNTHTFLDGEFFGLGFKWAKATAAEKPDVLYNVSTTVHTMPNG